MKISSRVLKAAVSRPYSVTRFEVAPEAIVNDNELQAWWPDLGNLVSELRLADQSAVADLLVEAVRTAATSGEILDGVGVVLRDHRTLHSRLGTSGANAWDAVMADVDRAYPGSKLGHWLALRRRSPP